MALVEVRVAMHDPAITWNNQKTHAAILCQCGWQRMVPHGDVADFIDVHVEFYRWWEIHVLPGETP